MHYKDGSEVKLGDLVRGKPYNTEHEVVGEVVGLVPGVDACNLRVAYMEIRRLKRNAAGELVVPLAALERPRMSLGGAEAWAGYQSTPEHDLEPPVSIWPCVDYGGSRDFELVTRGK